MAMVLNMDNFLIPKIVKYEILSLKASFDHFWTEKCNPYSPKHFHFSHKNPCYNQNFKIKHINLSNLQCLPLEVWGLINLLIQNIYQKELKRHKSWTLTPFFTSNFKMNFKMNPINLIKSDNMLSLTGLGSMTHFGPISPEQL